MWPYQHYQSHKEHQEKGNRTQSVLKNINWMQCCSAVLKLFSVWAPCSWYCFSAFKKRLLRHIFSVFHTVVPHTCLLYSVTSDVPVIFFHIAVITLAFCLWQYYQRLLYWFKVVYDLPVQQLTCSSREEKNCNCSNLSHLQCRYVKAKCAVHFVSVLTVTHFALQQTASELKQLKWGQSTDSKLNLDVVLCPDWLKCVWVVALSLFYCSV